MRVGSSRKLFAIFLVCSISLSGCGTRDTETQNSPTSPELSIIFDGGNNTLKVNSYLNAIIETTSSDCLSFASGFGVRYFVLINDSWEEIPDSVKYLGMSSFQIAKKDGYIPGRQLFISPDLSTIEIKGTTKAKAVIAGSHCDEPAETFSKEFEFWIEP